MRKLLQDAGRVRRPQHLLARADARARLHLFLHWPLSRERVLVTGGAGYIGSHAAKALRRAGYRVVVFDNLIGRPSRRRSSTATLVEGDIARRGGRARARCARTTSTRSCTSPRFSTSASRSAIRSSYYRNNVVGALSVLEAMAAESVHALRVLVDLRDLRRADRDADRRDASAAADQQLRRDQAGDRARAAALRARLRHALGRAALFQRRRAPIRTARSARITRRRST